MALQKASFTAFRLFFYQVYQEAKRVSWPSRKEVVMTGVLVFTMLMLFSLFLLVVDNIIAYGLRYLFLMVRS